MKNCDFCNVKDKKDLEDLIKYQDFDVNKKLDNLKKLQEVVFCDSINNRMDDFCNSINNRMDELYKIKKEIDSFFIKIGNKISYCGQCYYDIKYKNRHHTIDKGQILDCWYFTNKGKELLQKIYKNVGYFDIPSDGECWCCNVNITIEKCHIIPKSLGGSSTDPLNFVLLCNECHKKSPNTIDYLSFFKWLIFEIPIMRKKRIEWYKEWLREKNRWFTDHIRKENDIISEFFLEQSFEKRLVKIENSKEFNEYFMKNTINHFGVNGENPSTYWGCVYQFEKICGDESKLTLLNDEIINYKI